MNREPGWTKESSPFHQGERKLHALYNREERQEKMGRMMIRPYMPDQHRAFYAQLPFMLIGSVDKTGAPWASALFGP